MLVVVSSAASQSRGNVGLHVRVAGGGAVSDVVSRLQCLSTCTISGGSGQLVTLKASPRRHYVFRGWTGACVGAVPQCVLSLGPHLSVRAVFDRLPVDVAVTERGNGSVDCSKACSVQPGTTVKLRADALPGNVFTGWGGACATSTSATCTVKVREVAPRVTATFALAPKRGAMSPPPKTTSPGISISLNPKSQNVPGSAGATFAIVVANNGGQTLTNVKVTDALAPNCNYDETVAGYDGTLVAGQLLTYSCVRRNIQKSFVDTAIALGTPPSGQDVSAQDVAQVTIQVFAPSEAFPLNVSSSVGGTVTSKPPGISCGKSGGHCTSSFPDHATLTAHAAPGYYFARWRQNDACTVVKGPTCIVRLPVSNPRIGPVPPLRAVPPRRLRAPAAGPAARRPRWAIRSLPSGSANSRSHR